MIRSGNFPGSRTAFGLGSRRDDSSADKVTSEVVKITDTTGATKYRDAIGVAIQKAIEGAKPADLLAQAQTEFREILDKTEK